MDGLLIDTIPAYVSAIVEAGRDVGHAVSKDYVLSDAVTPTPEIEALCTCVAADLGQAGEIIRQTWNLYGAD